MALALILIVFNYVFDYLRTTDAPPINLPGLTTPVSPRAGLGFRLGAQPAAVYRVQFFSGSQSDAGGGTAFLVDAKCGIFATNAHVAEDLLRDGIEGALQAPQTGALLPITGMKEHPARSPLFALFDGYGPVGADPDIAQRTFVPNDPLDVAWLLAGSGTFENCKPPPNAAFPQPIALASDSVAAALTAGTPAAIIHYPGSGNETATYPSLESTARVEFGTIRALGSSLPVPLAQRAQSPLFENFLFLSAQVIGGSSGGVVLGPTGAAIGLIAVVTGNSDDGIQYQETIALPARIVAEVGDPNPDALIARYLEQAKARLKSYQSAPVYLIGRMKEAVEAGSGGLGTTATFGEPRSEEIVQKDLSTAFCSGGGDCIVASDFGSPLARGWFTRHSVTVDTSKINYVGAVDYDLLAEAGGEDSKKMSEKGIAVRQGFCPIALAQLQPRPSGAGLGVAQFASLDTNPVMIFPATFKGQQSVDLLMFRPAYCSDRFLKAHIAILPFTLDTRAPAQTSALETILRAANKTLVRFGEAAAPPLWTEE